MQGINRACGVGGVDCRPFEREGWFAVVCPPRCAASGEGGTVAGGAVGTGGGRVYSADSFACPAALHAHLLHETRRKRCLKLQFV